MSQTTPEAIKEWCAEEKEGIDRGLQESPDVPLFLKKFRPFYATWASGCWLTHHLKEAGCPEDVSGRIGFAHGQRSLSGDPYEWAARYFNEWDATKEVPEEPGFKLAQQIITEEQQ